MSDRQLIFIVIILMIIDFIVSMKICSGYPL